MAYRIEQWPASVQKKEIEGLPPAARDSVLVMLREMRARGPILEEYKTKRLSDHLQGLTQVSMKINREQIRILYSVYGLQIVVFHVFKKTSPQVEQRGYKLALRRKKTAEAIIKDQSDALPTVH